MDGDIVAIVGWGCSSSFLWVVVVFALKEIVRAND